MVHELPDLIGVPLPAGLELLKDQGFDYLLIENNFPGKMYPEDCPRRIVRQRWLKSGKVEITYSVDTYQLGNVNQL